MPLATALRQYRNRGHLGFLTIQENAMTSLSDRPQTGAYDAATIQRVSPPSPVQQETPPPEARTDPDRGTGELGTEAMDPSLPIKDIVGLD
jgi:hypothetical protein